MSVQNLPSDVLLHITTYLSTYRQIAWLRTCRETCALVGYHHFFENQIQNIVQKYSKKKKRVYQENQVIRELLLKLGFTWAAMFFSQQHRVCVSCWTEHSPKNHFLKYHLCKTCQKLDIFQFIHESECQYYHLGEDLNCVLHIGKWYYVPEVLEMAQEKHGSEKLEQQIIKHQRGKQRQTMPIKRNQRELELISALAEQGLELRADSSLCQNYISGTLRGDWTVEKIAQRMADRHYLHEYSKFDQLVEKKMYEIMDWHHNDPSWRNYEYMYGMGDARRDAESIVRDQLLGDNRPVTWPWLR